MYDGDLIAGCYSFTPSYYRIEGRRCLGALGLDLMIHQAYRRHGYFQGMFSACIDYMRDDGVIFIITFPSDVSYPGFIKSGLIHDLGSLTRYSQPDGGYCMEHGTGSGFVYKMMDYEGVRAAFLIDVFVKSAQNYNRAVQHIITKHHKEFDILLYVGRLPFRFHGLIKVPRRFSPKNFHFLGQILKEGVIKTDLFFKPDNWDINLSNYDLL